MIRLRICTVIVLCFPEVCSYGTAATYNVGNPDLFATDVIPAIGTNENVDDAEVLDEAGMPLTDGSTIKITPNTDAIKPVFNVMDVKVKVTGATHVIFKFYDEDDKLLKEVKVSRFITRIPSLTNLTRTIEIALN